MASEETQAMSPEQVTNANQILSYLSDNVESGWQQQINRHFPEHDAFDAAMTAVDRAMQARDVRVPTGVFVGSTAAAKAGAGLEGEDAQIAIQALKDNKRIIQLGRGRGKLLVLIDNTPLEVSDRIEPRKSASARRGNGEETQALQTENAELREQVKVLEGNIADLQRNFARFSVILNVKPEDAPKAASVG